jgi:metal-responsive CopG/Arc/MetJ family transcriptional regulator
MASFAPPVSVSITEAQLAWLDQRRRYGTLSRSALLRQLLDDAIAADGAAAPRPAPKAAANA